MTYDYEPIPEHEAGEAVEVYGTIWDQREDIGLWPALWGSIKQIVQRPADFFAGVDPAAPMGPGLIFYLLINVAVLVLSIPFQVMMGNFSAIFVPGGLAAAFVGLFLGTAIGHLAVRLLRGAQGFNGTLQVMMYATAGGVFGIVPLAGGIIGLIFTVRAAIAGYEHIHGFTTRRAAVAYFLPMGIFIIPVLIAAVAIPFVLQGKISANDSFAQARLRTISTAAETYKTALGQYPEAVSDLTDAEPAYVQDDFCGQQDSGFDYNCNFAVDHYEITATPVTLGTSGSAVFRITTGGELLKEDAIELEESD